jgi:hypothetical protein
MAGEICAMLTPTVNKGNFRLCFIVSYWPLHDDRLMGTGKVWLMGTDKVW